MWHDMFALPVPVAEKILRALFVYLFLVIALRLAGKRGMPAQRVRLRLPAVDAERRTERHHRQRRLDHQAWIAR
jgi:hypothetical protein